MTNNDQEVERALWLSELSLIGVNDDLKRKAQFAIRTAVRAQELASFAGTNPIDELLDARDKMKKASGQRAIDRAIHYLHTDQLLSADRDLKRQEPTVGIGA